MLHCVVRRDCSCCPCTSSDTFTAERYTVSAYQVNIVRAVPVSGVATGVDIGIYTPKISPSKLFMG